MYRVALSYVNISIYMTYTVVTIYHAAKILHIAANSPPPEINKYLRGCEILWIGFQ